MWLYIPKAQLSQAISSPETSSASLPGAGALTWDCESLPLMLAAFATWRGKSLRPASWLRVLRTALSTTRLCGLTYPLSTVARGADLWMASLAASRARTLAWRESEPASSAAIAADSSTSMRGSFAKFSRDGWLLKTSEQSSLFQQEESFSENLPPWGSMLNGVLFERPMLELRTSASGDSFWPTERAQTVPFNPLFGPLQRWSSPTVMDGEISADFIKPSRIESNRTTDYLARQAAMWMSPNVPNGGRVLQEGTSPTGKRPDGTKAQVGLENQVSMWSSPRASDGEKGGPNQRGSKGDLMLPSQASAWGTPTTRDWKDGDTSQANVEVNGLLGRQVTVWPSPTPEERWLAMILPQRALLNHLRVKRGLQPKYLLPAHLTPSGKVCWCGIPGCGLRSHKRKLNPRFVELLMQWPLFWTDVLTRLEPAAMELYLSSSRQHLQSLLGAPWEESEAA